MDKSHEFRNYSKLQLLIERSSGLLRNLFKSRYSLLNNGLIWTDSSECGSSYLQAVVNKNKKINLLSFEKTAIASGNIDRWQTTTFITLLLSMDCPTTLNSSQIQEFDQENTRLEQLKVIRNRLAHHPDKSIDDVEFNSLWTDVKTILLAFGDIDTEIDRLKHDSVFKLPEKSIDELNLQQLSQLNLFGTQVHKEGRYADAIAFFTKAKDLTNVPDNDLAVVYSNLAGSRLALYERDRASYKNLEGVDPAAEPKRALEDAKQARRLYPTWWKGHFRVGKAYAILNSHEKAINSFEKALAIDPTNFEIRKALDQSRLVVHRKSQAEPEYLDPRVYSPTADVDWDKLAEKLGVSTEILQTTDYLEKLDPLRAEVNKGHKYKHGHNGFEQNYEKAAEHFRRAAEQGNAEGMYNLAVLITYGLGVQQDHYAATELLRQAANQPPYHPVHKHLPNIGVADAEHALGVRYSEGITVEKNPAEAMYWYKRATEHGSPLAANNLGCMYLNGIGVNKDLEKAEHYLELASKRDNPLAMLNLAELLLIKGDFQMAEIWYDRACKEGNVVARQNSEQFLRNLKNRQESRNKSKDFYEFEKLLNTVQEKYTPWESSSHSYVSDYEILSEYAKCGSVTARIMCNALQHFMQACTILVSNQILTEEQEDIFICELSQALRIEHIVVQFIGNMHERTIHIVDRVLERCTKESNCDVSQLDQDARLCYAVLHLSSYDLVAQFLASCKKKYPKSVEFLLLSGAAYGFLSRPQDGLININEALEIEPNNWELLYHKAVLLRHLKIDMNEALQAYQKFLNIAPKDHRKVPEVYYEMALCYCMPRPSDRATAETAVKIMEKLYKQGKQAEESQLPCFLPYDSGNLKHLEFLLTRISLENTDPDPDDIRKSHLTDRHRVEVIVNHRKWEGDGLRMTSWAHYIVASTSFEPRERQQNAKSLVNLKPITLREMKSTVDHVYKGHVLTVTIIENALTWDPSIHLVVEDKHFYCERMLIYNIPDKDSAYYINEVYTIGSKMHIINPYLRIGQVDGKPSIRVDDVSSIVMGDKSERIIRMCRYCGKAKAKHVCSRCKQARYCSKECQTNDWKLYKHELICHMKQKS